MIRRPVYLSFFACFADPLWLLYVCVGMHQILESTRVYSAFSAFT